MTKKIVYREPDDYFPEEIRKKFGLGEYNTDVYPEGPKKAEKKPKKKTTQKAKK